jgi:hypothetical protein
MSSNKSIIGIDNSGNILISNTEYGDLVISSYDIEPNNYHDIIRMEQSNKIKIRLFNVRAEGFDEPLSLEMNIINDSLHEAFILVKNGWIPCNFMKKNTQLIADRNIIPKIQYRYYLNDKKGTKEYDYFDSIFLNNNQLKVDLTCWVLEANERKIPSIETMDKQLSNAKNILKLSLPDIKIVEYPGGNTYYHNLSNFIKETIETRMDFIFKSAPLINRNFTRETRKDIIKNIFTLADECKLKRTDIAVMLVFLKINIDGKHNPAGKVIKDSQNYTLEDAYNTACDLEAIELLINTIRFHENNKSKYNIAFITEDKGLAKLGALILNYRNDKTDGTNISVTSSFPMDIFSNNIDVFNLIKKYLEE